MSNLAKSASLLFTDGASTPVDQYDHEITLVDHTRPVEEPLSPQETDAGPVTPSSLTSSGEPIKHIWTRDGLRHQLTQRKYARYQEDKVVPQERPKAHKRPTIGVEEEPSSASQESPSHNVLTSFSQSIDANAPALPGKRDTVRHHKNKVKDAVKDTVRGSRLEHHHSGDESLFDVLYENQRGAFLCGIPRFSSKSLLNFDPPAWQTHTFHPSAVNITNAQLPDPSWVWADGWNSWYVDMSFGVNETFGAAGRRGRPAARGRGDTDEEGWRYSFAFGQRGRWAWHGTHPWFHSFVRRRRWVRLRVKRGHALAPEGAKRRVKAENEGHMFNAEYFTIHNSKRPASRYTEGTTPSERPETTRYSTVTSKRWSTIEGQDEEEEEIDIRDMPSLLKALRQAKVDREKITAVKTFLDQGGDELHYLAENMHEIMSMLIFQTSRQQLQATLADRLREAERQRKRDKHKEKAQDDTEADAAATTEASTTYVESLRRAVEAAGDESQRQEYWSDQRDVERGKDYNSSDECDEDEEDNEAPIGETTVFNDDVPDDNSDRSEFGPVDKQSSEAAPDRPKEQTSSDVLQTNTMADDGSGSESGTSTIHEATQAKSSDAMSTPSQSDDRPVSVQSDDLSSSPELTRFETAHEEPDEDDESDSGVQKTVISDYGQSKQ